MIAHRRKLPFLTHSRQIPPLRLTEEACLPESQTRCWESSLSLLPPLSCGGSRIYGKGGVRVRHNEEISIGKAGEVL